MTIRLSTSMIFQNGLKSMMETQNEVYQTQQQLATGKRLLTAADDPAASTAIQQLRESKERNAQYQVNADAADAMLSLQESVYNDMTNVLRRVRDLVIQGNNDTTSLEDRTIIAGEIAGLRDALIGIGNTKDINGDYLFSGNMAGTTPFSDSAGVVTYYGDDGVRELKIGATRNVPISENGKEVFFKIPTGNGVFSASTNSTNSGTGVIGIGSEATTYDGNDYTINFLTAADPANNVPATYEIIDTTNAITTGPFNYPDGGDTLSFAGIQIDIEGDPQTGDQFYIAPSENVDVFTTLQSIVDVFEQTGDDAASTSYRHSEINRAFTNLDNAMENIEVLRTESGTRLNMVAQQQEVNDNLIYQGEANISRLEDVDMVEAIMNFQMQLQALQASQQSFSMTQQRNLFDFI